MSATAEIPEGLVMEILSWVPAKSLLRFKCVSKTWCQWLSTDSVFINLHLDRSKNRNINPGIVAQQGYRIYFAEDPTTETHGAICFENPIRSHRYCRIVNVCNGLVCLDDDHANVYVWNPFTGDHTIIPLPSIPSLYSFGFHQASNEYKILRIVTKPNCESDVWVYTLGTDSWRNLGDIMDHEASEVMDLSTTIVNGALHWIGDKKRPFYIPDVLVSFDFGDEILKEIPQPNYGKFYGGDVAEEEDVITVYNVGELSGLLCIFRRKKWSNSKMEIWMMKEYGVVDSWAKQYIVSNVINDNLPLHVAYNEEIIIRNYDYNCQLILYNPKTNSIRCLNKFGTRVYGMNSYTGSLLSPTMIKGSRHSST